MLHPPPLGDVARGFMLNPHKSLPAPGLSFSSPAPLPVVSIAAGGEQSSLNHQQVFRDELAVQPSRVITSH